jgi:hypothetical protein
MGDCMPKKSQPRDNGIVKELILSDVKMYAQLHLNERDRISSARQWEITIIAAIIAFALDKDKIQLYLIPVLGVILAFASLELLVRARMRLNTTVADEVRDALLKKDDEEIISSYRWAHKVWAEIPLWRKLKFVITSVLSPEFITWNIILLTALLLLYFADRFI